MTKTLEEGLKSEITRAHIYPNVPPSFDVYSPMLEKNEGHQNFSMPPSEESGLRGHENTLKKATCESARILTRLHSNCHNSLQEWQNNEP